MLGSAQQHGPLDGEIRLGTGHIGESAAILLDEAAHGPSTGHPMTVALLHRLVARRTGKGGRAWRQPTWASRRSDRSAAWCRADAIARMVRMAVVPSAIVTLVSASVVCEPAAMLTTPAAILMM